MDYILSHPLGPLPWALASPDSLLRKNNKATLAKALQKNVPVVEEYPNNAANVLDGMNIVQRVKGDQPTFGDVSMTIFMMALREGVVGLMLCSIRTQLTQSRTVRGHYEVRRPACSSKVLLLFRS